MSSARGRYQLKPLKLFRKPEEVNSRILDACAVLTHRFGHGLVCTREGLGVVAASRGSMTGAITLIQHGQELPLDDMTLSGSAIALDAI